MNEIRQTKSSLSRHYFIQRSMSNSKDDKSEFKNHLFPLQVCTKKIQKLKEQISEMEEQLNNVNKEIENVHNSIPSKLKKLEKANLEEIQNQKTFLNTLHEDFERAIMDLHNLKIKEQKIIMDLKVKEEDSVCQKTQIDKYNYNLFKKGQFVGYIESQEAPDQIQESCEEGKVDKLLASIREAELELVKWQNVDCQYNRLDETDKTTVKSDQNEYLLSFIMDALLHYIQDEDLASIKRTKLDHLISLFEFSEKEMSLIKTPNKK